MKKFGHISVSLGPAFQVLGVGRGQVIPFLAIPICDKNHARKKNQEELLWQVHEYLDSTSEQTRPRFFAGPRIRRDSPLEPLEC